MPRPGRFSLGREPVPIAQEAKWDPGPVWTGAENLAPTGIRAPYQVSIPTALAWPTASKVCLHFGDTLCINFNLFLIIGFRL